MKCLAQFPLPQASSWTRPVQPQQATDGWFVLQERLQDLARRNRALPVKKLANQAGLIDHKPDMLLFQVDKLAITSSERAVTLKMTGGRTSICSIGMTPIPKPGNSGILAA